MGNIKTILKCQENCQICKGDCLRHQYLVRFLGGVYLLNISVHKFPSSLKSVSDPCSASQGNFKTGSVQRRLVMT